MANKYFARASLDGGITWEDDVELSNVGVETLIPSGLHVATQVEGTAWASVDTGGESEYDWCYTFDFRESNGGFEHDPSRTRGTWVDGQGWVHTDAVFFSSGQRGINIQKAITPGDAVLHRIDVVFTLTKGSYSSTFQDVFGVYRNVVSSPYFSLTAAQVSSTLPNGTQTYTWLTDGVTMGSLLYLFFISSRDGSSPYDYSGAITVHELRLYGNHTNPFEENHCEEADGLLVYKTSDYGETWNPIDPTAKLEDTSGGLLVPYPVADARYLFVGNYADGISETGLVNDDTNNLMRMDLNDNSLTNISPVVDGIPYGPVYLDNQAQAPRGSFDSPSGNKNILYLLGSDFEGNVGLFMTTNALADSPEWDVLIAPDVSVPYRKLVLDTNPRELYVFGASGSIAYTDSPTSGESIDSRVGNLSTSAEIIAIAGF